MVFFPATEHVPDPGLRPRPYEISRFPSEYAAVETPGPLVLAAVHLAITFTAGIVVQGLPEYPREHFLVVTRVEDVLVPDEIDRFRWCDRMFADCAQQEEAAVLKDHGPYRCIIPARLLRDPVGEVRRYLHYEEVFEDSARVVPHAFPFYLVILDYVSMSGNEERHRPV